MGFTIIQHKKYYVPDDDIKNFFDDEWWENSTGVSQDDFNALEQSLNDVGVAYDEEWDYPDDTRQEIVKIWNEQYEKNNHNATRERLLKEQLEYFEKELFSNQTKIYNLKRALQELEKKGAD